ncbi:MULTISPECIES: sulfite exporter TauE/SafE family protein [unclassified Microbacterium]|uniref:sulfite exporter TauE/SafE family protein n=1 Tax=unclassified Microbacterium TaxID=2609290 RepID=UPI000CFD999F|nr:MULTISPECIES: sulfite exporter TauE/SafE family protein [unclassified Microbacterium]
MTAIAPIARTAEGARRRIRRVWKWIRRHPLRTVAILVGIWTLASILGGNVILAYAADGDAGATLPFLAPIDAKDSAGISLSQYVSLPMDRGGVFDPIKAFLAQTVDAIWVANLTGLSWGLWFMQFIVTLEWNDWIAPPIEAIFQMLSGLLAQIGWIPVGLALAAIIGFVAIMRGRVAAGMTDMAISVAASVLAVTLLANPIGLITGPDGGLRTAQAWGGSIAASISSGDASFLDKMPSPDTAREVVSEALIGQVMDAWVRYPAQEIVFGQLLEGSCATAFNDAMIASKPFEDGAAVRDAIRPCAPEAAEYASNTNIGFVITAGIAAGGSSALNFLSIVLGLVLVIASGYTLWSSGKWLFSTYAAIAPGFARRAWWSSALGILAGLFGIGASIVLVSGFLSIATSTMMALAESTPLSTLAQMIVINTIVFVMAIALIWNFFKAKKAGEKLSERLARLGLGKSADRAHPIRERAQRMAENYVSNRLSWNAHQKASTAAAAAAGAAAATGGSPSTAANAAAGATPAPSPSSQPALTSVPTGAAPAKPMVELTQTDVKKAGGVKAAASKLLTTGASVALAAATGGTSAAVLTLTKEGGKYVLQRGVEQVTARGDKDAGDQDDKSTRSSFAAYGRQIVVDAAGSSRIAPREAPSRTSTYQPKVSTTATTGAATTTKAATTTAATTAAASSSSSALRARLAAAAASASTGGVK